MFKNYAVVAFRNLLKHKIHSFINIAGLSLAIALCIVIFMFVRSELSFDTFHEQGKNIYRVYRHSTQPGARPSAVTSPPLSRDLKSNYPEIVAASRLGSSSTVVKRGETAFSEVVTFVDPEFFDIFSFPIKAGNSASPLADISSMVISEEMARKYFGDTDAIGQVLTVQLADSGQTFVISAVADNMKEQSSIPFELVVSMERMNIAPEDLNSYKTAFVETYLQISETTTAGDLERKFPAFVERVLEEGDAGSALFLQPLSDIRLNPDIESAIATISNPVYSYVLSGLAVLVLFIACANFITLSIGRSTERAKEVGIRKVAGAVNGQLVRQFVGESLGTTVLAVLLGLAIAAFALPFFNSLSNKELVFGIDVGLLSFLLVVVGVLTLAAGTYPAMLLSRFQPAIALKGALKLSGKNRFSRGLIVAQFSLAIFLIIATLVMREQTVLFRNTNLGYDRERVLVLSMNNPASPEAATRLFERFKNAVRADSRILGVSAAMNRFGIPWTKLNFPQEDGSSESLFFNQVDADYLATMGVEFSAGRDFLPGSADASALVVNEALVRHFGWRDALREQIPGNFENPHRIVGVVKDFHFSSLHESVSPLVFAQNFATIGSGVRGLNTWNWPPQLYDILVRVGPGEIQPMLDHLEQTWADVAPQTPFELTFLDQIIAAQYAQEERWSDIINNSSVVALLIACLGLFGLTTVTVQKRVKEIGVRKVLGASISQIVATISKELLQLVAFANVLAWPLAYLVMNQWLQDFAYRIDVGAGFFLLSALATLVVAFLTIGGQAVKAALRDPADTLRAE